MKIIATALVSLLLLNGNSAQSFHHEVGEPLNYMSQKLLRGGQGLYYIGDSFLSNGEVVLNAFYECGDLAWSRSYIVEGTFVELVDMHETSSGDLLLYGSYFLGNEELIFLQKVDAVTGSLVSFNTYDPIFQDHFTYSLDIQPGRVMIYGLLLDFNIERRCFVAEFDESLNIRWAKNFKPFEKEGEAVLTENGIMGRSERFHFMLDRDGEQVWSYELISNNESFLPIGGPARFGTDFLYEARLDDHNFFYLLNEEGDLVWQSDLFPSAGNRSSTSELVSGDLSIFYYHLGSDRVSLASMKLDAAGSLSAHRRLAADRPFAPGNLSHFLRDGGVTMAGSPDPFSNAGDAYQDFHMYIDDQEDECFVWESVQSSESNNTTLTQLSYNFTTEDLGLRMADPRQVSLPPPSQTYNKVCSSADDPLIREELLMLNCGEVREVELPDGFIWDDLLTQEVRQLSSPGTFTARTEVCSQQEILNYVVEQPSCDCELYIPNIFSPNNDGVNDQLAYASSCTLLSVVVKIYNRWGEKVYESNVLGQFWGAEKSTPGVYVMLIDYEVAGSQGDISRAQKIQDIQLIR